MLARLKRSKRKGSTSPSEENTGSRYESFVGTENRARARGKEALAEESEAAGGGKGGGGEAKESAGQAMSEGAAMGDEVDEGSGWPP